MKRKKVYLFVAIMILTLAFLTIGCINNENIILPTEIRITYPKIYLGPTGNSAKGKIEAKVLPEDASNKNLAYRVDANYDEFLMVDSVGNLTAKKMCEEEITVTVFSQANNNVKATLKVKIEEVKASSVLPNQSSIDLLYNGDTAKVTYKFYPSHASLFTNVNFIAVNPANGRKVISVDSEGVVTPLSVGQASVMIRTEIDDEEKFVEAAVIINVMHKPLKYAISSSQQPSDYKQITGKFNAVSYTLLPLDNDCDLNPSIVWKIDGMPIKGQEGKKQLVYTPSALNVGNHTVSAVLTDASNRELTIVSNVPIEVYNPLRRIDVSVTSEQSEYRIGDTILFEINFLKGEYPPESYNWYIIDANGKETFVGSSTDAKFRYTFQNQGYFTFVAKAVVKGVSGLIESQTDKAYSIGIPVMKSDIFNLYVDGTLYNGKASPLVVWDRLPYNTNYTVEIKTADTVSFLSSANQVESLYFTENSCVIPENIATLFDDFTIRVKSDGFDFTKEVKYKSGEIVEEYYNCLGSEFLWHNAYIRNLEELGVMVNYIVNFRPLELMDSQKKNYFIFDWYFGFNFDEIDNRDDYPVYPPQDVDKYSDAMLNAYYSVIGAYNAYGDNFGFKIQVKGNANDLVTVSFIFDNELTEEYDKTGPSNVKKQEFLRHYTDNSRGESNDDFIINYLKEEMEVNTSNQLYLAVINGYKPKFTNNTSSVYRVYQEAKRVLNRIISSEMTDEEKVHAIYDFLTLEVVYDYELLDKSEGGGNIVMYEGFYLEGVFLSRRAVCDGLAKAFSLLCSMEGIKSYKISGITFNNVGHAWNGVVLNGEFYLNDTTWGIAGDGINEMQTHSYLNVKDSDISGTRFTYGKYPKTAETNLETYYNDAIDAEKKYNHNIDSDEEFEAIINYYVEIALSATYNKEDLWFEINIADLIISSSSITVREKILEYLEEKLPLYLNGGLMSDISILTGKNYRKVLIRLY